MLRIVLLVALLGSSAGWAQPADTLLAQGRAAWRTGNLEQAQQAFERAAATYPDHAEVQYQLARFYYESPQRNLRGATRALRQARRLEPERLEYMVAELLVLRDRGGFFLNRLFDTEQRRRLARTILSRDSTVAVAHEELGLQAIRDYWLYRNAVALPGLSFDQRLRRFADARPAESVIDPLESGEGEVDPSDFLEGDGRVPLFTGASDAQEGNDRFDLGQLQSQGTGVQDLSARGTAAYRVARGHLEQALALDPRRIAPYGQLMALFALADRYDEAMGVLGEMSVHFPDDPRTWLYLGLANHRLGHADAAARCFQEAFERMPPDEVAAFEDLRLLLPPEEREAYSRHPEAYALRYWTSQNPRLLTPYNARKLEHYSRLVYADLLFPSERLSLRGWETERGQLHIRYGVPVREYLIVGNFEEAVEAGRPIERPWRSFGFDMAAQSNLFNIWEYDDFRLVFEDPNRNGEFQLYAPPADLYNDPGRADMRRMDYVFQAREIIRRMPERYEYEAPGRKVPVSYLVSAFKGPAGEADLYVSFGIPLEAASATPDALLGLTLKTGAFLVDAQRNLIAERRRTVYGLQPAQVARFEDVHLWVDTQTLRARPGAHTVSVEFESSSGNTLAVQRRAVEVPDFGNPGLRMSDLLLAYRVEPAEAGNQPLSSDITRRDLVISPAPWTVFNHTQPIYFYFEVYHLAQRDGQTAFEVEARLTPKDDAGAVRRFFRGVFGGGRGRGVSVAFPVTGTTTDDGQYVRMDASQQEPGLYTLTLRIRDTHSGESAETERDLFLE